MDISPTSTRLRIHPRKHSKQDRARFHKQLAAGDTEQALAESRARIEVLRQEMRQVEAERERAHEATSKHVQFKVQKGWFGRLKDRLKSLRNFGRRG